jgi:hypothetical protein
MFLIVLNIDAMLLVFIGLVVSVVFGNVLKPRIARFEIGSGR